MILILNKWGWIINKIFLSRWFYQLGHQINHRMIHCKMMAIVTFPPLCHRLHGVFQGNSSSTQVGCFKPLPEVITRGCPNSRYVRYARSNILYQGMQGVGSTYSNRINCQNGIWKDRIFGIGLKVRKGSFQCCIKPVLLIDSSLLFWFDFHLQSCKPRLIQQKTVLWSLRWCGTVLLFLCGFLIFFALRFLLLLLFLIASARSHWSHRMRSPEAKGDKVGRSKNMESSRCFLDKT